MSKKNKKYHEVNGVMVPISSATASVKEPVKRLFPVIFENEQGNVMYAIIEAEDRDEAASIASEGELFLMQVMKEQFTCKVMLNLAASSFVTQEVDGLFFVSEVSEL